MNQVNEIAQSLEDIKTLSKWAKPLVIVNTCIAVIGILSLLKSK